MFRINNASKILLVVAFLGTMNAESSELEPSRDLDVSSDANEYLGEYYVELGDLERAQAQLDELNALCPFGCAQSDELERWIADAQT